MIAKPLKAQPNWYVVYTYPNCEKKVQTALGQKAIECFLPVQKILKQWSDRVKLMEVPLFPNYIFVNIIGVKRYEVLALPGVVRFVSFGGNLASVQDEEILTIQKLTSHAQSVNVENDLEEGDSVEVISGPFAGLTGVLFEKKGKTRFGVRIGAINQSISVEISSSFIKKRHSQLADEAIILNS